MSESQLKKLNAEKARLEVEAETVKELVTVSDACQKYVSAAWSLFALPRLILPPLHEQHYVVYILLRPSSLHQSLAA